MIDYTGGIEEYKLKIEEIIRSVVGDIIKIKIGTPVEDMKQVTDITIKVRTGNIAIRNRSDNVPWNKFHDITIRSILPSGHKTELDKIKEGRGKWYLYGWQYFKDWIFFDLDFIRERKLLSNRQNIPNKEDGTWFISIPLMELKLGTIKASYDIEKYLGLEGVKDEFTRRIY